MTLVGEESPVLVPPYSLATLLAEYSNPSQQFLEGKLREVPPRAGREVLELPAPWGPTEFMYTQHSEPLTVPFAEGIAEKGIQEMTWKLALPSDEQQGWISLVKAGFSDSADPVLINGIDVLPIQFLDQLVKRNIERKRASIPERQSHEIHLAIGCGSKDGRKAEVRCMVLAEPHELYAPYSDAATSMGASIAAQLLAVAPTKPGVWAPEEFFDVERYFSELRRRRFRFEVETRIWECAPSNLS